jgi:MFS family permease
VTARVHRETTRPIRDAGRRTFSSLAVRNYRFYFAGQGMSMVGTWMQAVGQSWLVYARTHSGVDVGLVVALQSLPVLLLGPLGGTLSDRFGKYPLLFWTQTLAGAQAFLLAALALTGHLPLWALYLIAVSLGGVRAVDNPTRQSFIIEMVGRTHVRNAVTLNTISNNVARAVGPSIAGVIIAVWGAGWCFLLNGISFVFVIAALLAMRREELAPAAGVRRLRGQVVEGLRYVAHQPVLRNTLLIMAIVGCFTYEFQTTLPLMAGGPFHGGAESYGFLTGCLGAGSALGGLVYASLKTRDASRLPWLALAFGVVVLLAALAPDLSIEDVVLLFVGAASVAFTSLTNSTLQLESEPNMRGRVMSLWSVAFQGTTPIGGPLVGWIAGSLGARYGLGVGAVAAIAVGGAYIVRFRGLHSPRVGTARHEAAPDGEVAVVGGAPRDGTGDAALVPPATAFEPPASELSQAQ